LRSHRLVQRITRGGVVVTELASASLSHFLRFLNAAPDGKSVADAMVHGPLVPVQGQATTIFAANGEGDLVLNGDFGVAPEYVERFNTFSINTPMSMCRAFREGAVVDSTPEESGTWFGDYDKAILSDALKTPDGEQLRLTSFPIMSKGRCIGVWNIHSPASVQFDRRQTVHLDGMSAAIGMWMALRDADSKAAFTPRRERLSPHARISERQLEVLQMLSGGKTNLQISTKLGFSDSTVKKEVQQVMVFLNVHDREAAVARGRELGLIGI
jgi:DNA-binding CsgD family transcriptional regulator